MSTPVDPPVTLNQAKDRIFNKMYISNVKNRLRALDHPSLNDKKRWPYELLQNAKDSVASTGQDINIVIRATDKEVIFEHDGEPFTVDSRFALLYKYSDGKENSESVGRFGTGFLTTHCLSKVVTIESDLWEDSTASTRLGFRVTMYRDGETDAELLAGQEEMLRTEEFFREPFGKTRFIYALESQGSKEAMRLGLASLKRNAAITMLFCPDVKSIALLDHDEHWQWVRVVCTRWGDSTWQTQFEVTRGDEITNVMFLHTFIDEENDLLSKRFRRPRRLRLTLALEVDAEYNLVPRPRDTPSCFCVFPLIGSEEQVFPVYISSPDFEPDSEREGLVLQGEVMRKDIVTDVGTNRMILERSVDLFNELVKQSVSRVNRTYLLASGL
jgi:hypothetical protein